MEIENSCTKRKPRKEMAQKASEKEDNNNPHTQDNSPQQGQATAAESKDEQKLADNEHDKNKQNTT